jgi:hypothetical protein
MIVSLLTLFLVFADAMTPLLGAILLLASVFVIYWGVAPELRG